MKYLIAMLALAGSQAVAQQPCGSHSDLVEYLADEYGESRQVIALTGDGFLMEAFAAQGGSWTIVISDPNGESCMVSAGEAFQLVQEPFPPMGEEG